MQRRLAPQDYHHFHAPVSGRLLSIDWAGADLYSVKVRPFSAAHLRFQVGGLPPVPPFPNPWKTACCASPCGCPVAAV